MKKLIKEYKENIKFYGQSTSDFSLGFKFNQKITIVFNPLKIIHHPIFTHTLSENK